MTRQQYVDRYGSWAVKEMQRTGIPASITLAQGILESDCGNSMLAVDGNNHFGIKCPGGWTGETIYKDDDRKHECFRSYESAYDSFRDHSDFLTSKPRYADLFELDSKDYKGWARGLRADGYATARDYADRLILIIEQEGLSAYDNVGAAGVLTDEKGNGAPNVKELNDGSRRAIAPAPKKSDKSKSSKKKGSRKGTELDLPQPSRRTPKVKEAFAIDPLPEHTVQYNNGVRYIELASNDTFENLAAEFHLMSWELHKYNDLVSGDDLSGMRFLYISPKRNRAHPDCPSHTVVEGDSIWKIAHKYGVKVKRLFRMNPTLNDDTMNVGDVVRLR